MDDRLKVLEEDAITVKLSQNDIEWIKQALEQNQKQYLQLLREIQKIKE